MSEPSSPHSPRRELPYSSRERAAMTDERDDITPQEPLDAAEGHVLPAEEVLRAPVARDDKGRFVKGRSGNPSGRKKGATNYIKEVQLAHEATLREYLAEPANRAAVERGLSNIIRIMQHGEDNHAVAAGKLLLDKLLPKGSTADEGGGSRSGVAIQVVVEAPTGSPRDLPGVVIEHPEASDED